MDFTADTEADFSTVAAARKAPETALLQMNAQLEEFTYVASHDLRAPLRGIADLLAWIREDLAGLSLPDSVHRNFERIDLRIARAERMIDDMLQYALSGRADPRLSMIDPRHLVEEVLALLEVPEHFRIEIDIAGSPFRGADIPLSLALRNVIANSFKHHGKAKARLRIAMREVGACNIFTIADDGVGVPAGVDDRIFNLFQRCTSAAPGHGLGLALARRAVNAHGGCIALDPENPLGGACFSIRWPRFPKEIET
jgi:two-component system sensor kinase FixL